MLEPDTSQDAIAQRDEEVVVTVMLGTVELGGLPDQRTVERELCRRYSQLIGAIGEEVQRDVGR